MASHDTDLGSVRNLRWFAGWPLRWFEKKQSVIDLDLIELPKYAYAYLDQVIGEYEAFFNNKGPGTAGDPLAKEVIDKYRSGRSVTWGHLYMLERLQVSSESIEELRARIPSLIARHAALSGIDYRHLPAFDAKVGQTEARCFVESTLREVYRLLAITACRERLRKRRLLKLLLFVAVAVLLFLGMLGYMLARNFSSHGRQNLFLLVSVPLMGALGGIISSQRRVQSVPQVGESVTDMTNLYFWGSNLAASAISGAVFAIVLCLIFAGGLVKGPLFPTLANFFDETAVSEAPLESFAQLLIWSFVAGFAERFVPDTLDHLVFQRTKKQ